jgi:hypothetical protein
MRWPWKRHGNTPARKPAGQQTIRDFLESGNWRSHVSRNTPPKNPDHPRYQAATASHDAALHQVDELIAINHAQQNLIELLASLGQETDDGIWLPK